MIGVATGRKNIKLEVRVGAVIGLSLAVRLFLVDENPTAAGVASEVKTIRVAPVGYLLYKVRV
jgi:hypothetical protein